MSKPRNARFWVYWNGDFSKITLGPGESRAVEQGGRTDEGWASEYSAWSHEGDHVRREWGSDGVDCDGRLSQHGVDFCPLEDLQCREPYAAEGFLLPEWQRESAGQRDYSAEAMGY